MATERVATITSNETFRVRSVKLIVLAAGLLFPAAAIAQGPAQAPERHKARVAQVSTQTPPATGQRELGRRAWSTEAGVKDRRSLRPMVLGGLLGGAAGALLGYHVIGGSTGCLDGSAHPECHNHRTRDTIIGGFSGAIVGGVFGALLGRR